MTHWPSAGRKCAICGGDTNDDNSVHEHCRRELIDAIANKIADRIIDGLQYPRRHLGGWR